MTSFLAVRRRVFSLIVSYSVLNYSQIDVFLHSSSETAPQFAMKENGKGTTNEMVKPTVILLLFAERLSKFMEELLSMYLHVSISYRRKPTHRVKVMI
jgi:hypothetical protein